jgi:tRNA(Met) C34 N-acetyltransferase TmcA
MSAEPAPASTEDLAAWLLTISQQDFRDLVAKDVNKRLDPEAATALRHPRVLVRWAQTLKVLLRDAHVQMQEKKHDPATDRDWFTRVARYESSITERQTEARALIQRFESAAQHDEALSAKRARGEATGAAITRLIAAHRAEFNQYVDEERELAGLPPRIRPGGAAADGKG